MLTEQDLKELISYRPGCPVLSVYLNVDPKGGAADAYKLRLRQMLKEFERSMPQDADALERYVEHEYNWSGRSLAMFSCAKDDFLQTYSLQVPVRDRARALERPYVKPLADMMDHYGHYGVALVDQQGARLFSFHMGSLREEEGARGEVVRRRKVGGSQASGGRGSAGVQSGYVGEVLDRNLREAAKFSARFFQDNHVRRILVGGTEANVSRFIEALPKMWRSLIVGSFPMNINAGHTQVLNRAMEIGHLAEQEKENQLVKALLTAAAKGGEAVLSLDETLGAVHEGRVRTLMISEGFRAPGYRCRSCKYASAFSLEACPFCGGEFETIPDAVELAVRKVMQAGGEVEVIHQNPMLDRAGKIGALLRY